MSETYTLTKSEYNKIKHLLEKEEKKYNAIGDLVGGIVFIRTATHYYTGELKAISGKFAILETADTGRFATFMKGEGVVEVEPMGSTAVNIDAIIDISPYKKLLIEQK